METEPFFKQKNYEELKTSYFIKKHACLGIAYYFIHFLNCTVFLRYINFSILFHSHLYVCKKHTDRNNEILYSFSSYVIYKSTEGYH